MNILSDKYNTKRLTEAGTDEAGRGCLAGPVVAAAVILNPRKPIDGLNDSKALSEAKRNLLRLEIEKKTTWAVAFIDNQTIDKINILKASILAMHKALSELAKEPGFIIVDGNRFLPFNETPYATIVKGDAKYKSIAAASILAKTHRDEFMEKLAIEYPHYGWEQNKGYPTKEHREAIQKHGTTPYHRMSYKLFDNQLKLF